MNEVYVCRFLNRTSKYLGQSSSSKISGVLLICTQNPYTAGSTTVAADQDPIG